MMVTGHYKNSYIDWFLNNGVNVIIIPHDTKEHEKYFKMINGLVISGSIIGENRIIPKRILNCVSRFVLLSLHEYFPIWGTCFGLQLLACLIGGCNKLNIHYAKGLYPIKTFKSRMFTNFTSHDIQYLEHSKSTYHNHKFGFSVNDFKNVHLKRFYNISATAIDDNNKEYVAAIEAKYYPIYGTQFHPERYNSGPFIDFFISELRKNKNVCKSNPMNIDECMNTDCYFL